MIDIDKKEYVTKFGNKIRFGNFLEHSYIFFEGKKYNFNFLFFESKDIDALNLIQNKKLNWSIINFSNRQRRCIWKYENEDKKSIQRAASHSINFFIASVCKYEYRSLITVYHLDLFLPSNYTGFDQCNVPENLKNEKFEKLISKCAQYKFSSRSLMK